MVSDADLEKFISLFEKRTSKRLSKEEALPKLLAVLQIVKLVRNPMTERQLDETIKGDLESLD